MSRRFENATVRGRAWYKLLDAPVLTVDVTVSGGHRTGPVFQPSFVGEWVSAAAAVSRGAAFVSGPGPSRCALRPGPLPGRRLLLVRTYAVAFGTSDV